MLPTYTLAGQLPSPCVDDDGSLTYVQPWHMSFKTCQLPTQMGYFLSVRMKVLAMYLLLLAEREDTSIHILYCRARRPDRSHQEREAGRVRVSRTKMLSRHSRAVLLRARPHSFAFGVLNLKHERWRPLGCGATSRFTRSMAGHAHVKERLPRSEKAQERFREFSLAGKVFAVTGGARGLGLSMAEALVEAGGRGEMFASLLCIESP